MKKLLLAIIASVSLMLSSCDAYAQAIVTEDGLVYEYSYNNYPAIYIDGIAYYYCLTNNIWRWITVPSVYYNRIIHHLSPRRYHFPPGHGHDLGRALPPPRHKGSIQPHSSHNRVSPGIHIQRAPSRPSGGHFGGSHGPSGHRGGRR